MVTCYGIRCGRSDLRIVHGLVFVFDVCMYSNFLAFVLHGLKSYDALACKCGTVKGKGKGHFTVSLCRSELCGSGNFLAASHVRFTGRLIHELAFYCVGLARDEVLVFHNIVYSYFFFCQASMGTGLGVGRGGMRVRDMNSLTFIRDLCMDRYRMFAFAHSLERYHALVRKCGTVERKGQFYAAVRCLRCELCFCGYLLASDQEFFAGFLIHEDTGHGVLFVRCQVLVCNDIFDGDRLCCESDVVTCYGIRRGRSDLRIVHGLILVVDVCVYSNFFAFVLHGLKSYDALARKYGTVKFEGQDDFTVRFFSGEFSGCSDFLAISQVRLTGRLIHELALYSVGLAGDEVLVFHNIVYSYFFFCQASMGTGLGVGRGGMRVRDMNSLTFIRDLCMDRYRMFAFAHSLERYHALVRKCGTVERKGQFYAAVRCLRCELCFCGYLLASDQEFFAGFLIHEDTGHGVLFVRCQVLVCNDIFDGDLFRRESDVVTCYGIRRGRSDLWIVHGLVLVV